MSNIALDFLKRPAPGCENCLKINGRWLHLRYADDRVLSAD